MPQLSCLSLLWLLLAPLAVGAEDAAGLQIQAIEATHSSGTV